MTIPRAGMKAETDKLDRRSANRFSIGLEVRFKVPGRRSENGSGSGRTMNISRKGVLFTTDHYLAPGSRLELSISWPGPLNGEASVKLMAHGRVVRCEGGNAAVEIKSCKLTN